MRRYAITNRAPGVGDSAGADPSDNGITDLLEDVRRWAREDVDYVQLREKDLTQEDLRRVLKAVFLARDRGLRERAAAPASLAGERTRILVSTSVEAALAEGADGVHLTGSWALSGAGPGELAARIAVIRRRYAAQGSSQPVVSVSCHTVPEVRAAATAGADLLLFGPVFGKMVGDKPVRAGVGLYALAEACAAAQNLPLYALGGVTWTNATECLAAGAAGIAGIRLFKRQQGAEADSARSRDGVAAGPRGEPDVRK